MEKSVNPTKKKNNNSLNWLLWWQIDKDELNQQVEEYETLKFTQSARGISLLLLLLSAAATLALVLFLNWNSLAILDVFIFLILGLFIYKGHRWAMVGAMILWTYEKIFIWIEQYQSALAIGAIIPNPIIPLIWWTIYMHAFYLAFQVERKRIKKHNEEKLKNINIDTEKYNPNELEKLADLKNKGIITEDDFNKKKKQILGI